MNHTDSEVPYSPSLTTPLLRNSRTVLCRWAAFASVVGLCVGLCRKSLALVVAVGLCRWSLALVSGCFCRRSLTLLSAVPGVGCCYWSSRPVSVFALCHWSAVRLCPSIYIWSCHWSLPLSLCCPCHWSLAFLSVVGLSLRFLSSVSPLVSLHQLFLQLLGSIFNLNKLKIV